MTTPATNPRKNLVKVLIPVAFIIVVVVCVLALLRSQLSENEQPAPSASVVDAPGGPGKGADVGSVLPNFGLTPIGNAKAANLADFHSRITLINFWATWCEACMEEMPSLVQLRNAYKDKGFEVVGIDLDENASSVVPRAVKQLHISFPVFQDPENKIADFFDVHAIPLSAVMRADRKILYIENGERNWNDQETRQQMEKWLAGT